MKRINNISISEDVHNNTEPILEASLKKAMHDYKSGDLKNPVILYYPDTGCVEACQAEDCGGDAFESLSYYSQVEKLSDCLRSDYGWERWPSDEITEENIKAYIIWRFGQEGETDEH